MKVLLPALKMEARYSQYFGFLTNYNNHACSLRFSRQNRNGLKPLRNSRTTFFPPLSAGLSYPSQPKKILAPYVIKYAPASRVNELRPLTLQSYGVSAKIFMEIFNFFGKAKNGIMNGGQHRTGCARVAHGMRIGCAPVAHGLRTGCVQN